MTVTSANYSSIEEVWGEQFPSASKSKKEKRKKIVDPICELYEMGNNNGYTDNDLITYANTYFEKQDKGKNRDYQRSMNDLVTVFDNTPSRNTTQASVYRENPTRYVDINTHNTYYDTTEDDEDTQQIQQYKEATTKSVSIAPAPRNISEAGYTPAHSSQSHKKRQYAPIDDDDYVEEYEDTKTSNFAFIDLLLYIVSGIILIFVMEQFVKIGILLQ